MYPHKACIYIYTNHTILYHTIPLRYITLHYIILYAYNIYIYIVILYTFIVILYTLRIHCACFGCLRPHCPKGGPYRARKQLAFKTSAEVSTVHSCQWIFICWSFNIAREHPPFIDDVHWCSCVFKNMHSCIRDFQHSPTKGGPRPAARSHRFSELPPEGPSHWNSWITLQYPLVNSHNYGKSKLFKVNHESTISGYFQ